MTTDKFSMEVHKRLCAMDEGEVLKAGVLPSLMKAANDAASAHPLWYERFRISSKVVRAWRWLTK